MISQRPYLLRALYDWIVDSDEVPYVLVNAAVPGVVVPEDHVQEGQIVLNIGASATRDLHIGDDFLMFSSRFNGRAMELILPVESICAIYCKDSGEGMVFPEEGAPVESLASLQHGETTKMKVEKGETVKSKASNPNDEKPNGTPPSGKPPGLRLV